MDRLETESSNRSRNIHLRNCHPNFDVFFKQTVFGLEISFGCNFHPEEVSFGRELMTPATLGASDIALSTIIVAMMEDLGYNVDYSQVDPFTKDDIDARFLTSCNGTEINSTRRMLQDDLRLEKDEWLELSASDMERMKVIASVKVDLKMLNKMADSFAAGSDDDTMIMIPGMMAMCMDEEGGIRSVDVENVG